MKQQIKQVLKNVKGVFSILVVITVFIVLLSIMAFSDIASKSWAVNEIQSIMDTSGMNALQTTVDTNKLRAEIFSIDNKNEMDTETDDVSLSDYERKISAKYKDEIRKHVKTNKNIVALNVEQVKVDWGKDTWGLGETQKKRPQIVLDTVSKVRIKSSSYFDDLGGLTKDMYNARNGSNFTVTYNGQKSDGTVELIIRSVTRMVYR
ncbi:hypothetical protein [Bacillus thuringiensis]|uniref:hypothetical protein n=1 Tax=Bacillus thuringiensis TaxID=1428 RepID=UPI0021B22E44|nr:hypothetical protein [Bacillus thuringiensis]